MYHVYTHVSTENVCKKLNEDRKHFTALARTILLNGVLLYLIITINGRFVCIKLGTIFLSCIVHAVLISWQKLCLCLWIFNYNYQLHTFLIQQAILSAGSFLWGQFIWALYINNKWLKFHSIWRYNILLIISYRA